MKPHRQTQVLAALDRMSGRTFAAIGKDYARQTIAPLVAAIDAESAEAGRRRLDAKLFRQMDATALAKALWQAGGQAALVGRTTATPRRARAQATNTAGGDFRIVACSIGALTTKDFTPRPPEEARKKFQEKAALTSEVFERLSAQAKQRAFRIAGVHKARLITAVKRRIDAAMKRGKTWAEARKELVTLFDAAGVPKPTLAHLRQNFVTNTQQAYNDARREVLEEERETFPYWQYLTVGNGTAGYKGVRAEHAALHKLVFRADDPFWDRHYPPWGFHCRCTVIALTPGQVAALKVSVRDLRYVRKKLRIGPDESFIRGRLDLRGIEKELQEAVREMIERAESA